eukprot:gene56907-biopygen11882
MFAEELVSGAGAGLVAVLDHACDLAAQHLSAVAAVGTHTHHVMAAVWVEAMLRAQLVAAIGREVGPADFAEYGNAKRELGVGHNRDCQSSIADSLLHTDFHHRRLFRPEFRPAGFCYAVRRPGHY